MPDSRRTARTAGAWIVQAGLAYHAGRISAEQYRQVIEQHRRHAEPARVLDDSEPVRTV